jgi:hypothetical protein
MDLSIDMIALLRSCRAKLRAYQSSSGEPLSSEDQALSARFLRYAVEIQILLQAHQGALRRTETGWGREASRLMKAYQSLPYSIFDAEQILDVEDFSDVSQSVAGESLVLHVPISSQDYSVSI